MHFNISQYELKQHYVSINLEHNTTLLIHIMPMCKMIQDGWMDVEVFIDNFVQVIYFFFQR